MSPIHPAFELQHNITKTFYDAVLKAQLNPKNLILEKKLDPNIVVVMDGGVQGFKITASTISVSIAYLDLLWASCYAFTTIYNESVRKPMEAGSFDGQIRVDFEPCQTAWEILKWVQNYSKTNDSYKPQWPRPKSTTELFRPSIEIGSGIFTKAVTFSLFHELSHSLLGHLSKNNGNGPDTNEEFIEWEKETDNYAFELLVPKNQSQFQMLQDCWPFVIGALIRFFIIEHPSIVIQEKHPDLDERLRNAIEVLNLTGDFPMDLYHMAAVGLHLTLLRFGISPKIDIYEDSKALFYSLLDQMQELKNRFATT